MQDSLKAITAAAIMLAALNTVAVAEETVGDTTQPSVENAYQNSTLPPIIDHAQRKLAQADLTQYEEAAPQSILSSNTVGEPEEVFAGYTSSAGTYGCDECGDSGSYGGLFVSDHEFDSFVEPISNPIWFMDPRSRTRVRGVFLNQQIPEDSILAGGDLQVYALQVSVALTDRLSLIANKDGYNTLQTDAARNADGWADIAGGLQYVLLRDVANQFLFSGGILFEFTQGSTKVFQGNGDGMFHFYLTTGKGWERSHFISTLGWHLPINGNKESESMYYSFHLDYEVVDNLYAVWEINGIHYIESGGQLAGVSIEGGDYINLGATNVTGNDFWSMAFGASAKLSKAVEVGAVYEFPFTGREDLFDNRVTVTMSWTR